MAGEDPTERDDRTVTDATIVDASAGRLAQGTEFTGYVIEGVAGRGGMGVVYRARQLRPARTVALKVISPALAGDREFRERFEHESEIAASIEHSNVIPVYEVGEHDGLVYIVMRYVEGTDLGSVIESEGRLEPARAVGILAQLTAALDAAHERGLVHRDVKPGNVLLAREGASDHVYLTDFGLAKLAAGGGRTQAGMFVGTLDYAAPEQLEGRSVDGRTDVYAAGCVLFHMLTGVVPFAGEHQGAIMLAHINEQPRSVRELVPALPPAFDAVIARAMAKDPARRYQSAGELGRDALDALGGTAPTLVDRPGSAPRSGPAPRFLAGAAALAAIVIVAVLAAAGVFSSSGRSTTSSTTSTTVTTTSRTTTPALAVKTYSNPTLGVSFSYPATWGPFTLKGSPADFGVASGANETRCALEIERGTAPASGTQEAQFAFVRARSAFAAKQAKHYELRAIQAERGANILGVGLVRVADGEGGHLGFFFKGRDTYIFDCITTVAANLDTVDRQDFVPLLASVKIG